MSLELTPLTRLEAQEFIRQHHRHHAPPPGDLFRVGAAKDGKIVGVGMARRPQARMLNDGRTVEIVRVATSIWIMAGIYTGKLSRKTYPPERVQAKLGGFLAELIEEVAKQP